MSDDTCDHPTAEDEPCQHPACRPDGKCWMHTEHDPDTPGRPTKLNLQRQENIAQAVEKGKSFTSACRKSGITPQTGIRWMQLGEDEDEGPYREFFERLTRAKGVGQDHWEQRLHEVTQDPATIMAILKTQYPDTEWGDAKRGEQEGTQEFVFRREVVNEPDSN